MARKRGNNEESIYPRKDGTWVAQMSIARDPKTGKPKRAYFYAKTRKEAADKLTKALRDHQQGILVEPHKLTLGEWLDKWLWHYKRPSLRSTTFDNYEMLIHHHLKPALGNIAMRDLRPEHLQHFYNEKGKEGLSSRSVQLMHTVAHGALSQAEKNQLVARNVSRLTERPQGVRREAQTLTAEQVGTSLLPALRDDRLFAVFYLVFGAGLRRGELLALRWKDINLNDGVLQVRQTLARVNVYNEQGRKERTQLIFQEPKTAQSRRSIPMPEACLDAMKRHKAKQAEEKLLLGPAYDDHGLAVCQPDGKPIDPRNFLRYFKKVLKQAGLPDMRIHDARHTFATMMLELGESPKTVQTMLGHSRIGITLDIYSHVSLDLEKRAAAKLNAALGGEK